ncbi:unnamed protein product, partial [Owenia fusiformis]
FNCKDQGYTYVVWVEYASQGDTGITVWHTGGQVSNPAKYEVDSTSANKYKLTIKNVQMTDAGKYECRTIPSAGPPKDYAAQLTVIGTPSCPNSNGQLMADIENPSQSDKAQLVCSIDFRGVNSASLSWYDNTGTLLPSSSSGGANSLLEVNTTFPVRTSYHGEACECRVTVQNIQDFQESCYSSPKFEIVYPVLQNIKMQPFDDAGVSEYMVGEHMNCTGEGNPMPTYQWEKISGQSTELTVNGQTLMLKSDMIGENTYRCYVENMIKGMKHEARREISFTVRAPPGAGPSTTGANTGAIVGGVIGGLIGLAIIIVIVYFLIIKRPRDRVIKYPTDEDLSAYNRPQPKDANVEKGKDIGNDFTAPQTEVEGQVGPDYIYSQPDKSKKNPETDEYNGGFRENYDMDAVDDNDNPPAVPFKENGHDDRRPPQYQNAPPGGFSYGVNVNDVNQQGVNPGSDTAV